MPRAARRLALIAALIAAPACGGPEPIEDLETIELSEVPAQVMAAARAELPKVEFDQAWVEEEADGGLAYELRGMTQEGKTREVKVAADGTILETE